MHKQKKWQLFLIIAVTLLTIYNILPTVFYYTKPLKKPINETQALSVAKEIEKRINSLESKSIDWIKSFNSLLGITSQSIELSKENPEQITINFKTVDDATKFRNFFPRAGALIPFQPSQMSLLNSTEMQSKKVVIQRQIPIHFDIENTKNYFDYAKKFDENNNPTAEYRKIIFDRISTIAVAIAGPSDLSTKLNAIYENPSSYASLQLASSLAQDLIDISKVTEENPALATRFFGNFTQGIFQNKAETLKALSDLFSKVRENIKMGKIELSKLSDEASKSEKLSLLEKKELNIIKAQAILKKHENDFLKGQNPWDYISTLQTLEKKFDSTNQIVLDVGKNNPIIKQIVLDWPNEKLFLKIHEDLISLSSKNDLQQMIINEIARITNLTDEQISKSTNEYVIAFNALNESKSLLILNLPMIAEKQSAIVKNILLNSWNPIHEELLPVNFPVYDYKTYQSLKEQEKTLCFVIFNPTLDSKTNIKGLKQNSIYVIAKGLNRILQKYQQTKASAISDEFIEDFNRLRELLRQNGYIGFPGIHLPTSSEFANDFIFEKDDYYNTIINASRENFQVHGSKKYATLEFSNLEQRILTANNIETKIHENIIKWKEEYNSAQVSINHVSTFDVPAPTENLLLNNIKLSLKKYFRGDDRKILHWGLDLSGGKTVQLELKDQQNKIVKNESDLKQGVNELYNRVNKMGVSDVNIRIVDNNIVLDFPGAQNLSASELIKASTMYFHVVNEKFSPANSSLAENVNRFLQEVWNEAVVTNRKDIESINSIAWKHLYGESSNNEVVQPRSDAAKILYENGLRLASSDEGSNPTFDETLSKIAIFRGKEFAKWEGQTNPLLIVFNNFALDGSSLVNIRSSYDPSKGNFLSFEVKGSQNIKEKKINSSDALFDWTNRFSKEKISGTSLEQITKGRGWRMAVILNDTVISAPNLESALRDRAMITGSFTQREINQLVADLKAGSLSYTPHILSEKNVSPELGQHERTLGIVATFIALVIIFISMIGYYRFAGLVASVAVVFNLLILWAILQNIQATLTLAGIAGVILTVGMAVDANVLVFERFKEEFAISGKISSAVKAGYKRAFSAILDSNLTTIIAALILLNFDSGPIKGFAITLIIGIASSMFTALFMTKFFFTHWIEDPRHTELKMHSLIKGANFNFLKNAKFVYSFNILLIIFGMICLVKERKSIMGMDFTGGFSINIELDQAKGINNYRSLAEKAFEEAGAGSQDFQVRELNTSNSLRILFGTSMELDGKPFYNLPISLDKKDFTFQYETNPRINWIVSALHSKGLTLTNRSLENLDKSWTAMSGQMSESMRNNALIGLGLALLAIFIYTTWRFEFKYSISAILCLIHDVLISLGSIALLNMLKVPIQIDMHTVAALMTIIGYSLNDTIIIFDRIREDYKLLRKYSFKELVNQSLNTTLSRTTITSLLTLFVVLCLVFLGGSTIFSFALVMTIGIIFGTLSSIFIASPLMLYIHNLELKKHSKNLVEE